MVLSQCLHINLLRTRHAQVRLRGEVHDVVGFGLGRRALRCVALVLLTARVMSSGCAKNPMRQPKERR